MSERIWKFLQSKFWGMIGVMALAGLLYSGAYNWRDNRFVAERIKANQLALTLSQVNNLFQIEQVELVRQVNSVLERNGYRNLVRPITQQQDTLEVQQ